MSTHPLVSIEVHIFLKNIDNENLKDLESLAIQSITSLPDGLLKYLGRLLNAKTFQQRLLLSEVILIEQRQSSDIGVRFPVKELTRFSQYQFMKSSYLVGSPCAKSKPFPISINSIHKCALFFVW